MTIDIRLHALAAAQPAARDPWPQITLESLKRLVYPSLGSPLLLGYCEDGVPLVLDLKDGHLGPILIFGDKEHRIEGLLRTLLLSAAWLPRNEVMGVLVFTDSPQDYEYLLPSGLQAAFVPIESARLEGAVTAIAEFCHVSEWRRLPNLLLVLDNMEEVRGVLRPEIADRLQKQILAGIPSGIVPILCSPSRHGREQFANSLATALTPSCILTDDTGRIPLVANQSQSRFEMGIDDFLVWTPGYREVFRLPVDLRSWGRDPIATPTATWRNFNAEYRPPNSFSNTSLDEFS